MAYFSDWNKVDEEWKESRKLLKKWAARDRRDAFRKQLIAFAIRFVIVVVGCALIAWQITAFYELDQKF